MRGFLAILVAAAIAVTAPSGFSQVLEWEGFSLDAYDHGTPSNPWIIVQPTAAYSYQILDTNYQQVASFSLTIPGYASTPYIMGASPDFDTDSNIEVLYDYMDTTTYFNNVFLRDIATGTNQLVFSHPDTTYYATTFYFDRERVITVTGYDPLDWENTMNSWLYRSNNPQGIAGLERPEHDISPFLTTYPNPARRTTRLEYSLPVSGTVQVAIYDASGRELKTFAEEHQPAGNHRLIWDGTDKGGRPLPSGRYFCQVKMDKKTITRKMILLR